MLRDHITRRTANTIGVLLLLCQKSFICCNNTLWVRTRSFEVYSIQHYVIKFCQCLAAGRWFSPGTPVFSTNKTNHQDITEILLKVVLNTIIQPPTTEDTYWLVFIPVFSRTLRYFTFGCIWFLFIQRLIYNIFVL